MLKQANVDISANGATNSATNSAASGATNNSFDSFKRATF
jgi:hypothetical protein